MLSFKKIQNWFASVVSVSVSPQVLVRKCSVRNSGSESVVAARDVMGRARAQAAIFYDPKKLGRATIFAARP
jgi:hypothetical protein